MSKLLSCGKINVKKLFKNDVMFRKETQLTKRTLRYNFLKRLCNHTNYVSTHTPTTILVFYNCNIN